MDWALELGLFPSSQAQEAAEHAGRQPDADDAARAMLAWSLRQQDSARAVTLAGAVLAALQTAPEPAVAGLQRTRARMRLVQAEHELQALHLEAAQGLCAQAEAIFIELGDLRGQADCAWIHHYVAADRGDTHAVREQLQAAERLALACGDASRLLIVQATLARSELFRDQAEAAQRWDARLPRSVEGLDDAEAAALADFRGLQAGLLSSFAPAATWLTLAYERSLSSGQLRRAMSLASNIGYTYTKMSDHVRAIEWLQRGLALARQANWPGALSLALAQTGDAMRCIGQTEVARELLLECLDLLSAHPQNRSALLALKYLAECELQVHQDAEALAHYETLADRAVQADSQDLRADAALGRARALLRLQRPEAAREAALAAHEIAQAQRERSTLVDICWVMAEIEGALGRSASLCRRWLDEALDLADSLPGYQAAPGLLDACGQARAAQGEFEAAYRLAQRANQQRQQLFTEDSSKHAAALHSQHQLERAKAEQEHLRRLAEAEAARAQAAQRLHQVLLHLGDIGQEITALLDVDRVFAVLKRHVQAMLVPEQLAVYLSDEDGAELRRVLESGHCADPPSLRVDDGNSELALCWRERRPLMRGLAGLNGGDSGDSGDSAGLGVCMVGPLRVADRAIGVMRVVAAPGVGYGEKEQLVFRSLCAHLAIALDNARAYERLGELQRQVAAQEKMASIGQLAAGVAHEINNPISFVNSNLGSLRRDVKGLLALVQAFKALDRAAWPTAQRQLIEHLEGELDVGYLAEDLPQLLQECEDGLERVTRIVLDLRSFSRVDAMDWEDADLRQGLDSTLRMLANELVGQVEVQRDYGPLPLVHCLAAQIHQVFMNLLTNALQAIEARSDKTRPGLIQLSTRQDGDWVRISIRDNGCGMSEAVRARVFEPFFTTRDVGQGTGLGLSIAFSIVKKHGGTLSVSSSPGEGSCFELGLPLRQAEARQPA